MVRQSDVRGAYARVGDPSVKRSPGYSGRWLVIFGFLAVIGLFVTMGRNTHRANDDNERSGQAHHSSAAATAAVVATPGTSSTAHGPFGDSPPATTSDVSSSVGSSSTPTQDDQVSEGEGEDDGYGRDRTSPHSASGSGASKTSSEEEADDPSSSAEDDDGKDDDRAGGAGGGDGTVSKESDDGRSASGDSSERDSLTTAASVAGSADETSSFSSEAEHEKARVEADLKKAEEQEVKAEEAKAQSTLGKLGSGLRVGLAKLFGDKASEGEIEEMAQAVESEVTAEVNQEIEVASSEILTKEVSKVHGQIESWRNGGEDDTEVANEIQEGEDAVVAELKHSVDEIEERVEQSIRTRASMAEKKILEERLSKKLGKKVKLTYVEQEERFDGMDEVMEQLPSLRGSTVTRKKRKKKKKKQSSGSTSSSPASHSTSESREEQSADKSEDADYLP